MTDHLSNDLSHLSNTEFNLLCPQGEHAPGPEPLSPAAQAVKDAFLAEWPDEVLKQDRRCLAAAFRAAADHLSYQLPFEDSACIDVVDLLAVANELENYS
jgi:hypothetical protein